jgi:hypothetical protein
MPQRTGNTDVAIVGIKRVVRNATVPKPNFDPTKYRVLVDDNFHYMDPDSRWTAGEFDSAEEAVAKCRLMVDEDLAHLHKPGMTADQLYASYTSFGDDPFVVSPQGAGPVEFSAWDYAKQRCAEICGQGGRINRS